MIRKGVVEGQAVVLMRGQAWSGGPESNGRELVNLATEDVYQ